MTYELTYDGCTRLYADGFRRASHWLYERDDTVFLFHDCGQHPCHTILVYHGDGPGACYDRVNSTTGLSA